MVARLTLERYEIYWYGRDLEAGAERRRETATVLRLWFAAEDIVGARAS